ncbi:MAG: ABC transporter ATP-binding protein [Candidatus Zixiibacteriota bacterium]|nr:MAG: ABC transporter ATP-binding protein [candidate division Zixibacteria bacterium]
MAAPLIQIEDIHKSFDSLRVLEGVSLNIERGESIVVIGQSGCGKSVLIKHLIRLLEPDSGRVIFDGEDIGEYDFMTLSKLRLRFGMLFQSAALFDSMTVEENVGLGLTETKRYKPGKIREIVNEKLELVGLTGVNHKRPAELSGGMRKRVGLARAIANSPEVLLYDEPTTGLDPITADMINKLIVDLREKLEVTSVAVTHDMKSAFEIADRIVMLYGGKIEFDGTPDEVRGTTNPVVRQFISGSASGPIQA